MVPASGKDSLKISWVKLKEADGYDVYWAECGEDFSDRHMATVAACSLKLTKLNRRDCYKAYVLAWKKVGGKKVYIAESPVLHAISGGYDSKYCNPKSIKLNKSKLSLKRGKSATVKATVKGVKASRKLLTHVRKVRWFSSDPAVATVNSSGKVKAVGKGSCTIYAITGNGLRASVKVTVK